MGTVAPGHPQGDHQAVRDHPAGHGHTGRHPPSPLALPAPGNRRLKRTSTPLRLSAPWGLLEPYAATSGTYGSEGAPVQQCIGATQRSSLLVAVAPVLCPSCMLHGPIAPGGEADRGSRRRRRAAETPAGTPDAVDVLGLHSGQAPNPGTSSRTAGDADPGSSSGPGPVRRSSPGNVTAEPADCGSVRRDVGGRGCPERPHPIRESH